MLVDGNEQHTWLVIRIELLHYTVIPLERERPPGMSGTEVGQALIKVERKVVVGNQ